MATVLVSVRLSPELAAAVDRAARRLEGTPSGLVEALLDRSEPRREEILKAAPPGPFTEKRNLRLSPETLDRVRRLAGDTTEPSVFIRQVLAYFFSVPDWARLLLGDNGRSPAHDTRGTASSSRRDGHRAAPPPPGIAPGHPLVAFLVLFVLLLPLLVTAVEALIRWLRRRRARPGAPPGPPTTGAKPDDKAPS